MINWLKKLFNWCKEYHGDPMPIMMVQILDRDNNEIYICPVYQEQIKGGVACIKCNGKDVSFIVKNFRKMK